jgi:hypothetical protein
MTCLTQQVDELLVGVPTITCAFIVNECDAHACVVW